MYVELGRTADTARNQRRAQYDELGRRIMPCRLCGQELTLDPVHMYESASKWWMRCPMCTRSFRVRDTDANRPLPTR